MESLREALTEELEHLRQAGLYRRPRRTDGAPAPRVELEGRSVLNFGSNNYLGLTGHPRVRSAAREAAERWGTGSSGSRLTTGNLALHEELEAALARLKGTEAALLFPSGYQANLGLLPALAGRGDLILSDALNHASLIDGCRLSRAEVRVYRHGDVDHLRALLHDRPRFRRALVVTDGVFSMDGDLAPLPELCALCEEHDLWLVVDDAHGTGVLGATGSGTAEHLGVRGRIPVQMGTLSKALGAEGGFVAGPAELIDFLRNRARSFIFSTAPAPPTVAAALAALQVLQDEPGLRATLHQRATQFHTGLQTLGLEVPRGETPILPVLLGDTHRALAVSRALEDRGIWAPAIRPPTVPEGTSRLRMTVMATHTEADIQEALAALNGSLVGR